MTDAQPPDGQASLHVLAADDNAMNRAVLTTIMEAFGASFEIVENGREAVEAWRRGRFDLILMDVQMPTMDGLQATAAIRQAEAVEGRARVPIVALSANTLPEQVQGYLDAGMDAFVAKPIELDRLKSAMDAAARSRTADEGFRAG